MPSYDNYPNYVVHQAFMPFASFAPTGSATPATVRADCTNLQTLRGHDRPAQS
jgi:hypothetical protein